MKETINLHAFREGFRKVRPDNFTYEGLGVLFEYLEDFEDDTGEELEFDVIWLCCEFAEDDWQTIAKYYELEQDIDVVIGFLGDAGAYIGAAGDRIVYRLI